MVVTGPVSLASNGYHNCFNRWFLWRFELAFLLLFWDAFFHTVFSMALLHFFGNSHNNSYLKLLRYFVSMFQITVCFCRSNAFFVLSALLMYCLFDLCRINVLFVWIYYCLFYLTILFKVFIIPEYFFSRNSSDRPLTLPSRS